MYKTLNVAISGLRAQNDAFDNIAADVSNIHSDAYKRVDSAFKTMISGFSEISYGVNSYNIKTIDIQGQLYNTGITTNIAIDGNGMFAIAKDVNDDDILFTRLGSFTIDKDGYFVNGEGGILKGWNLDQHNSNEDDLDLTIDSIENINISSMAISARATEEITVSANLDAKEDIPLGREYVIKSDSPNNVDNSLTDIIYPEGIQEGDGFVVSSDEGNNATFVYGGFTRSNSVSLNSPILGAASINDDFSALIDGDQFIIRNDLYGDTVFVYNQNYVNSTSGSFNNMHNLSEAINTSEYYNARIIDNKIYISPENSATQVSFSNVVSNDQAGISNDITFLYGQDSPRESLNSFIVSSTNPIYGATDTVTVFNGITDGSKFKINLTNGNAYTFTFDSTSAVPANSTFNSFDTLVDAINYTGITELEASIINNNQMKIDLHNSIPSSSDLRIVSCTGNTAEGLGINLDSLFVSNIKEDDTFKISLGSLNDIPSRNYFEATDTLNALTKVQNYDPTDIGARIISVNNANTLFNAVDGDNFTITTDSGPYTFTYRSTAAGVDEFSNISELATAISNHISGNLESSFDISTGILNIKPSGASSYITSIDDVSGSIASQLGLLRVTPTDNDIIKINLSTGDVYQFSYLRTSPDTTAGQFNSLTSLAQTISEITGGKVITKIEDGRIIISCNKADGKSINSISGKMADYLGLSVQNKTIELKFSGKNGSGANGLPDPTKGEYNDIFTLNNAINTLGGHLASSKIIDKGKKIHVIPAESTKILYIDDTQGNTAQKMGLHYADIVSSLGLNTLNIESNHFSTLAGLSRLIEEKHWLESEKNINNISLFANNMLSELSFHNLPSNYENSDIVSLLGLPTRTEGPYYDSKSEDNNMSSGTIKACFSNVVKIYDSLGTSHNIRMNFIKFDQNKWGLEIAANPDEIISTRSDGLIAYASLNFNGDGSINNIDFTPIQSGSSEESVQVRWKNQSNPSDLSFYLGAENTKTSNLNDNNVIQASGIRQLDTDYRIDAIKQDGYEVGQLKRINIENNGIISGIFSNGSTRDMYKIPVVTFPNINNLEIISGSMYSVSRESGNYILSEAGKNRAGSITSRMLEASNVLLSDQITRIIKTKHASQMNLKVLQTADKLLEEIGRLNG